MILADHSARIILVGFGSVGRGVLPLILRHIEVDPALITIVTPNEAGIERARYYGVCVVVASVTQANHRQLLLPMLARGDLLLNCGLHVSSAAMIDVCHEAGALYLDTSIEPWPGILRNIALPPASRTNHALRRSLHAGARGRDGPTALVAHGANPGLVSHFVKHAMLRLATDMLGQHAAPKCRAEWAALGKRLGIKAIHITERDSQASAAARGRREFVNTWSVEGLVDEACQPAELGWGTHEQKLPPDGCHLDDRRSIFLTRPGGTTLMQSWTPRGGSYRGLLLSHMEALTIADHFTVWDGTAVAWRPTVHFVYRPCDDALASIKELADSGWTSPYKARVLMADIVQGADELGVLLMGRAEWSFWFGSHLTASAARNLAPSNNATTLQVAAGILGGLIWVLENPRVGLREPDEIDHKRILQVARPYLGEFHGFYSNWSPVHEQTLVSPAVVDFACPWQFSNFRVSPTPDQ